MGDVCQALDTKLGRLVAIKLLPEAFALDPDRVARFDREARALASLNHPHIATIYGLEESAEQPRGRKFLVMELVVGPTLHDMIAGSGQGLPAPEALRIAQKIAEALEAAHEKGIVHRDLKPANIRVSADGQVKVLDFGLAKAFSGEADANLSNSPTLSLAATQAGIILGTAAYMSPEQPKGAKADHRSDVFSFGCVLYEMLTARQAFQGETTSDILASVLAREPDLTRLPPDLNSRLHDLLRRCLEKPPRRRWQAVGDLRMELEVIAPEPYCKPDVARTAAPQAPGRTALAWVLRAATALLVVALAIPALLYFRRADAGRDAVRFLVAVPDMPNPLLTTISPDGRKVAFVAAGEGGAPQLFVRPLESVTAERLAGTEGATNPFWSPDSRFIAFTAGDVGRGGTLK